MTGSFLEEPPVSAQVQALHDAYTEREAVFAASWPTALTGTPPPAPSAISPSPPTPNSAAATPLSRFHRSVPPNPNPNRPPAPSAPNTVALRASRPAGWVS